MNYIKKCIISKLENEIYNSDLLDIGNSIGEVVAKFIDENKSGYEKESFLHGINNGLTVSEKEEQKINETIS
jgi:hypothetical protein